MGPYIAVLANLFMVWYWCHCYKYEVPVLISRSSREVCFHLNKLESRNNFHLSNLIHHWFWYSASDIILCSYCVNFEILRTLHLLPLSDPKYVQICSELVNQNQDLFQCFICSGFAVMSRSVESGNVHHFLFILTGFLFILYTLKIISSSSVPNPVQKNHVNSRLRL